MTTGAEIQPAGNSSIQATIRLEQVGGNNAINREFGVVAHARSAPDYNVK